MNASLAAFAAVTAFFMIKHKELIREDDAKRKDEARKEEEEEMKDLRKRRLLNVSVPNSKSGSETTVRRPPGVNAV